MADDSHGQPPEVVLHTEQAQVGTELFAAERVLLRKRIVTQLKQFQVTVQREELVVERLPVPDSAAGGGPGRAAPAPDGPPLVVVLSEQVPVVQLQTRPYERVTARVVTVTDTREVTTTVRSEQAEVLTTPTSGPITDWAVIAS